MKHDRALLGVVLGCALLGVAPHVQTAGYYASYEGLPNATIETVAHWLTWAETDADHASELRDVGVKTMDYTDPNRVSAGQAEYSSTESDFAHDCNGDRIATTIGGKQQYLMDPHSGARAARWRAAATQYARVAHYDAIFEDDADDIAYLPAQPCNYSAADWLRATNAMQAQLGMPVIYNGLSRFVNNGVSDAIGLNATAIGGMAEQCYGVSAREPTTSGWQWRAMEETERLMARAGRLFFCYDNDTSLASASTGARLYVYASFLLTYDLDTSILWEYYTTLSSLHVMPEVELVPLDPQREIGSIDDLRQSSGTYERMYRRCYLDTKLVGECLVVVNPDSTSHPLDARGFRRTLVISGAGVLDGGTARVADSAPPQQISPHSAVIAFH